MKNHPKQRQRQRVLWDTSGVAIDSLEYFYNSVSVENEYVMLAALETQKGNYTQALSMLGTCQVGGVQDDLCMVQKTIAEAKQADQFCPAFTGQQMTELNSIATNEKSPGYAIARSLLRQHTDSSWAIDIRIMPETKRTSFENKNSNSTPGFVKVHPNPASGEAFFTSKLPEGVTEAELVLTDSFGKIVWRSEITGNQIIPLNLSRFTSGVYVYSLYMDGVMTESHKLVISK